jgi:AbrB family looped-hinge helix DNA binding protein
MYQATITKKGQVLIPKKIRDVFHIGADEKLSFFLREKENEIVIRPMRDILDLAGTYKPKKRISALRLRETLDKKYERK